MEPPQIKGSLDFVLANEFGNDIAVMPVLRTKINDHLPAEENYNAVFSQYRLLENYPAGQRFKIKFTTNAPAFVYIFAIDDKQVISPMFPYAENISPAVNSRDATIYLPSETKNYKLSADAARDRIFILYSKTAIDFDNLKSKITTAPANIYATLLSLFGKRLIPVNNIRFQEDKISFSSLAAEQELVCVIVDLNYK